ncbi:MAG: HD domain-containing protein [Desulfosarcinaceae bacterium]|nr:HD domain-containing protein [Desulfosarcinaceae bacterium]
MQTEELAAILTFLRNAESLKHTYRSAWTSAGEPESVAAHTWRLALMAMLLAPRLPQVDLLHLLKICLIHDLGEALNGDIPAIHQTADDDKSAQEREDLLALISDLPEALRAELLELWEEYETAASPEARLAKGLDKLETILQHNQGRNPSDFDYAFNLGYGRRYTAANDLLVTLRRMLDNDTRARAERQGRRMR